MNSNNNHVIGDNFRKSTYTAGKMTTSRLPSSNNVEPCIFGESNLVFEVSMDENKEKDAELLPSSKHLPESEYSTTPRITFGIRNQSKQKYRNHHRHPRTLTLSLESEFHNYITSKEELKIKYPDAFDFSEYFQLSDLVEDDGQEETNIGLCNLDAKFLNSILYLPKNNLHVNEFINFAPSTYHDSSCKSKSRKDGYFSGIVTLTNICHVNMIYLIKPSIPKMFRLIPNNIGHINPGSTNEIILTTNPEYKFNPGGLKCFTFQVYAYPVLFRSQLERLNLFWELVENSTRMQGVESHLITTNISPHNPERPGGFLMRVKTSLANNNYLTGFLRKKNSIAKSCIKYSIIGSKNKYKEAQLNELLKVWNFDSKMKQELLMRFQMYQAKNWSKMKSYSDDSAFMTVKTGKKMKTIVNYSIPYYYIVVALFTGTVLYGLVNGYFLLPITIMTSYP